MRQNTVLKALLFFLVLVFAGGFLLPQQRGEEPQIIYLAGGQLIDGLEKPAIKDALVIIKGNRIAYAGQNKSLHDMPPGKIIDCSGKTMLPGLCDAHIHLGGSCTLGYIQVDDKRKLAGYLYCGVTAVFDLAAVGETIFRIRDSASKGEFPSPRIFAVGPCFTSPAGHGTEYGVPMALTPETKEEAREAVQRLAAQKPDLIKIIYEKGSKRFTSISFEMMEAIINEAHKNNLKVVTHITTLEQAKDAVKAGSDGLAHMVADREVDEELLKEMKKRRVFCIPTLAVYEGMASLASSQTVNREILDSPLLSKGVCREILKETNKKIDTRMYSNILDKWEKTIMFAKKNLKKMAAAGIKLVLGTDAGNPNVLFGPAVHRELQLMVDAGLTPHEAIITATHNLAAILEKSDQFGSIKKGQVADILVVEGDPLTNITDTQNISMVIQDGSILDRDRLARLVNPPGSPPVIQEEKLTEEDKSSGPSYPPLTLDQETIQKIKEARLSLKQGLDTWDADLLKKARISFINLLGNSKDKNVYLLYYTALSDYRLTTYYLLKNNKAEAEKYNIEGKKYLEKAMQIAPSFAESDALYASVLGYDIALHPDKAMVLGFKSYQIMAQALEKDSLNPRINLLKGVSLLYTPEAYGGGAKNASAFLKKAVDLFAAEKTTDPVRPTWGYDEAYTFLGIAYKKINDIEKAKEHLKKALEINPDNGLAAEELKKLQKEKK